MLKKNSSPSLLCRECDFAIVASKYNAQYVDAMVAAARTVLEKAEAKTLRIIRVPGAFEIPVVATALARQTNPRYSAIICLGLILRGATSHAQHIGEAVSHALVEIQVRFGVPVIHEVLVVETKTQAAERCLDPRFNRGTEAAQTALEMAFVMQEVAGKRLRNRERHPVE